MILNDQKVSFKELLKFPCFVDFRIIIKNQEGYDIDRLKSDILKIKKLNINEQKIQSKPSSKGSYISYILPVEIPDEATLMELYDKIGKLEYVMHII